MRITKLSMMLLGTLSLAALLNGCGSSSKESAISAGDIAKVDEASCRTCHSTQLEPLTGDSLIAQFNNSPHVANGCQSCHGGGSMHNGVGPLPFPKPGSAQCAVCHTDQDSADYAASGHAHVATEDGEAKCNRCHTHEGAVLGMKNGFTGDKSVMDAMVGAPAAIANASVIQCSTCHVMHEGKLRTDAGWTPAAKVGSATVSTSQEYNLCTGCHTYINEAGQLVASGNNGTASFYHNTAWNRVIASTHYDDPATPTKIEGYVIRTNAATPCFDCHGHEAKTNTNILARQTVNGVTGYVRTTPEATIYTDWAKSGHGGGLITAKYAAVDAYPKKADGTYNRTAGMTDAVMAANSDGAAYSWGHYPWQTAGRAGCQKCHTATGAANYMKNPSTYNAANNDFSHLKLDATGNGQQELLYCWGCHSNAGTGALNNPGAVTTEYKYNAADIKLPDAGKSNGCLVCHTGRGNVQSARSTRFEGHHAATGADIFAEFTHVGFEFTGQNYAKPAFFAHDKVGMSNGAGPCVGCHMNSASHSFGVVTKDANGLITSITTQPVCNTCHTGQYAMTAAKLEEEGEGYREAGVLLKALLANTVTNYKAAPVVITTTAQANAASEGDYGSYQNAMYPAEDPGGFAHNRYYVKRLIFDSIDWMQHGAFTGSITVDAATYPHAAAWLGTTRP